MADARLVEIVTDLSRQGTPPLFGPENTRLTLREAVAEMFVKLRWFFDLKSRPRSPGQSDDLLGHVLSMRVEGLITQALLAELLYAQSNPGYVPRATADIRAAVIRSLQ